MKLCVQIFLFVALMLPSTWVFSSCEDESIKLVAVLEAQALGVLSNDQRQQVVAVVQQQCESRQQGEKKKRKDFFTDYMLSGESGNKAGNDRLKKRSR